MNFNELVKMIFRSLKMSARYIFGSHVRYRVSIEQYPDIVSGKTDHDLFPKTKGFLTNDLSRCTGCGECITACPVSALKMDKEILSDGTTKVNQFDIHLGRCYLCSACVDICPVSSIDYTKAFELAVEKPNDLILSLTGAERNAKAGKFSTKDSVRIRTYEVRR